MQKTLDQICLTKAYKEMIDEVGDWVPATAGHMVPHHQRLKSALDDMYELHLRAEKGESPASLEKDVRIRYEELSSALEEWVTQGRK